MVQDEPEEWNVIANRWNKIQAIFVN